MTTIEHRVSALESSLRRWRIGALCLVSAAVGLGLAKTHEPRPDLEVRSLSVINDKGDLIAALGPEDGDGNPVLAMFNTSKKYIFEVRTSSRGAGCVEVSDGYHSDVKADRAAMRAADLMAGSTMISAAPDRGGSVIVWSGDGQKLGMLTATIPTPEDVLQHARDLLVKAADVPLPSGPQPPPLPANAPK